MRITIGTCSICGGRVSIPNEWLSVTPPIPTCDGCGAKPVQPHGPIIQMEPAGIKPLSMRQAAFKKTAEDEDTNSRIPMRGEWDGPTLDL